MTSPWMTPKQAATYTGISVSQLANWRGKNTGPAFSQVGRYVRYHAQDLDDFLQAARVEPKG